MDPRPEDRECGVGSPRCGSRRAPGSSPPGKRGALNPASFPLRLLHLSDLHFGPKHVPEAARAILRLVRDRDPALVVVSGDLTQRARPSQFRAARTFLDSLERPVVWVPGNHDVPLYRLWERFLAPFWMWKRHFAPECVQGFAAASVAIVAVNTAHGWTTKNGRVRRGDLVRVRAEFAAAPPGAFRILVAHHPLLSAPDFGSEPPARGGAELVRVARDMEVELVLSGHLHWTSLVPRTSGSPALLHAGTSASRRGRGPEKGICSLNLLEVSEERIDIDHHAWRPGDESFTPVRSWRLPREELRAAFR